MRLHRRAVGDVDAFGEQLLDGVDDADVLEYVHRETRFDLDKMSMSLPGRLSPRTPEPNDAA